MVATGASAVLTWLQAKKHNELNSSHSLAAHEIVLIKSEAESVESEKSLSDFVVNSESAFSREHTQWSARKNV
ncbi:MAG: SLATT domain-containing protein [Pseudomonadales bacterium]